jgi:hypothetical protein
MAGDPEVATRMPQPMYRIAIASDQLATNMKAQSIFVLESRDADLQRRVAHCRDSRDLVHCRAEMLHCCATNTHRGTNPYKVKQVVWIWPAVDGECSNGALHDT